MENVAAKPRRWNTAELQHTEIKQACQFAQNIRPMPDKCEPVTKQAHEYDRPNDKRSQFNIHNLFNVASLPFYRAIPFRTYITKEEVEFGG